MAELNTPPLAQPPELGSSTVAEPAHAAAPTTRQRVWLVALGAVAGALLLRSAFASLSGAPSMFLIPLAATVLAAWYGGFLPGVVVTVLLAFAVPWTAGSELDAPTLASAALYLLVGVLASALWRSAHDARARLEERVRALEVRAREEERLSRALSDTGVSLYDLDRELRYTWVRNPLFGMQAADIEGKTALDLYAPREAQRLMQARARVLETGVPLRGEFALTGPTGTRYLELVAVPLRDSSGAIVGLRSATIDTTERREERERTKDLQGLFRVAQDQSLDPFEVLRPVVRNGRTVDFVWEYLNPAAAALFDGSGETLVGRRLLHDPDDRFQAARCAHWIEVIEQGVPRRADFSRAEGGVARCYQTLSVSLGDRLVATTRDASAQVRWLADERAARGELERTSKLKDEFLANLSHELRAPLNAIVGWAHLLGRAGADAGVIQRASDAIGRNARAQVVLVNDLLDLNLMLAGTLRVGRDAADVSAALQRAIEAVRAGAEARWITLDTAGIAPGLTCLGDAERLQQIFWHLLTNAIKFTPLNGRVWVRAARHDGTSQVEIRDNGEGIAAEVLPHVFERFQQADSSTSRQHGGLGLGLAIVKSLVELHEGAVGIESAGRGQGTTVQVTLPLAGEAISPRTERKAVEASEPRVQAGANVAAPLAWRRILLLEDDPDSLEMTSVLLREQGAIVRAFDRAEDALAAAENGTFDLVISDLGIPGMDGLEFMRRLKRRPLPLKAIALTAYSGDEQRERALEAGFTRVELKPIAPPRFLEMVIAEVGR